MVGNRSLWFVSVRIGDSFCVGIWIGRLNCWPCAKCDFPLVRATVYVSLSGSRIMISARVISNLPMIINKSVFRIKSWSWLSRMSFVESMSVLSSNRLSLSSRSCCAGFSTWSLFTLGHTDFVHPIRNMVFDGIHQLTNEVHTHAATFF